MQSHNFKTLIHSLALTMSLCLSSISAMENPTLHCSNIAEYLGISSSMSEVKNDRKIGVCISESDVEYPSPLFEGTSFQWIGPSQLSTDENLKNKSRTPTHGTLVAGTLVGATLSQDNPAIGNWGLCRDLVDVHVYFQNEPLSVINNPKIDMVCFSEFMEEEFVPHLEPLIQAGKTIIVACGNDGWNLGAKNNKEFQSVKHLPIIWVSTYDPPSRLCGTSKYLTAEQIIEFDDQNGAIFLTFPHHIMVPTSDVSPKTLRGCSSMAVPVLASLIATFLNHNPDFSPKNVPALLRRAKKVMPVAQLSKGIDYPLEDLFKRSELGFLADWLIALKTNTLNASLLKLKEGTEINAIAELIPKSPLAKVLAQDSLSAQEQESFEKQLNNEILPEFLKGIVGLEINLTKQDLDEIDPLDKWLTHYPYAKERRQFSKTVSLNTMESLWAFEAKLNKAVSLVTLSDLQAHTKVLK